MSIETLDDEITRRMQAIAGWRALIAEEERAVERLQRERRTRLVKPAPGAGEGRPT